MGLDETGNTHFGRRRRRRKWNPFCVCVLKQNFWVKSLCVRGGNLCMKCKTFYFRNFSQFMESFKWLISFTPLLQSKSSYPSILFQFPWYFAVHKCTEKISLFRNSEISRLGCVCLLHFILPLMENMIAEKSVWKENKSKQNMCVCVSLSLFAVCWRCCWDLLRWMLCRCYFSLFLRVRWQLVKISKTSHICLVITYLQRNVQM